MKHKLTQTERIAATLLKGRTLTPIQALNQFGCFRLGARIHDLKKRGLNIRKELIYTPDGARVAKYKLAKLP